MVPMQVLLIAGGLTLLVYGGGKVVHGVKKLDHAIAAKFHHKKPAATPPSPNATADKN